MRFRNSPELLDKIDFRWLKEKANAASHYAVSSTMVGLDLFYAYKGSTIERYLLFIGDDRSGSSILGHLLDVHPEMAVSHQKFILRYLSAKGGVYKRGRMMRHILASKERFTHQYFPLKVRDQWLGRYSQLRVIGDKSSRGSTIMLYERPSLLDRLRSTMGVPLRVLCTCRNPYDMVAAKHLRYLQNVNLMPKLRYLSDYNPADSEKHGLAPLLGGYYALDWLLDGADKLTKVLSMFSEDEIFLVRHEDFIASPKDKLRDICTFLGVECAEDYLDSCVAVVYPSPHKTRFKVRWTAEEIERVAAAIEKYPWFEGYTLDD